MERVELKKDTLRRKLPRGATVYTVRLRGPSHRFLLLCAHDGRVYNITSDAREVCGRSAAPAWVVKGYNFNHAGSCVEELGEALYADPTAFKWETLNPE